MRGFVQTVVITFHWSHSVARSRAEERAGQGRTGEETLTRVCARQHPDHIEDACGSKTKIHVAIYATEKHF